MKFFFYVLLFVISHVGISQDVPLKILEQRFAAVRNAIFELDKKLRDEIFQANFVVVNNLHDVWFSLELRKSLALFDSLHQLFTPGEFICSGWYFAPFEMDCLSPSQEWKFCLG